MKHALRSFAAGALATVAACILPASAQDAGPQPAPGGDPALACGQKPNGRAYWTEYGWCDLPIRGPAQAKGLILWSHGLSGDREQYTFPPSPVIRRLTLAGWDVIKINRNNLYERNWTSSGVRHRDDLLQRIDAAHAAGYRKVVAAGHSYGGAIALEAGTRTAKLHAVLAFSPGHGSDASADATARRYDLLDKYLLDAVAGQKSGRVLVMISPLDEYHPNRASTPIGPRLRATLRATGRPFVQLDETMPVAGHGAGYSAQFDAWFGSCIADFVDPARSPVAGETTCVAPATSTTFLLPAGIKTPKAGTNGPARFLGRWEGVYDYNGMEAALIVESIEGDTVRLVYANGAGPKRMFSMIAERLRGRIEGDRLVAERTNNRRIEIRLGADGRSATLIHTYSNGTNVTTQARRVE